jgi:hypothetical protein
VSLGIPFHLKKKVRGVANFREPICKNHIGQNVGKEKQKSTFFGIFYKKLPMSKLWILFHLKFPHCIYNWLWINGLTPFYWFYLTGQNLIFSFQFYPNRLLHCHFSVVLPVKQSRHKMHKLSFVNWADTEPCTKLKSPKFKSIWRYRFSWKGIFWRIQKIQ